ncbi:MAG: DedA family protein [Candidatus Dojkabacteria bacterium]|nr:DedA family protein [Candidatus Dojkabacteria bacterium]
MIENIVEWLTNLMNSLGYLGIGLAVFLETIFPPIPSAFIQPFAGFVASRTDQTLFLTIVAATIGTYLGTFPFYLLGIWGEKAVYKFLKKYGKYLFIEQEEVDKAFEFFNKYGKEVVLFGRLVPLVRTFISFPAGVAKMPFWQFTIYTLIGSAIWSTILAVAGYLLGENWEVLLTLLSKYENIVLILFVLSIAGYILFKVIQRKRFKKS